VNNIDSGAKGCGIIVSDKGTCGCITPESIGHSVWRFVLCADWRTHLEWTTAW